MTPPTPAAVRAAMKRAPSEYAPADRAALVADRGRSVTDILRDHIRAVAAGMRNLGDAMTVDRTAAEVRQVLREYADRLEGREP